MKNKKKLTIIISAVAACVLLVVSIIVGIVLHEKSRKTAMNETSSSQSDATTETETEDESETNMKPVDVIDTETQTESEEKPPVIDDTYYVTVNRVQNIVIIYKQDENKNYQPIKAMICSVGREGGETTLGEFRTSVKWRWAMLNGEVYGQYVTRFNGPYLFHSVPYKKKSLDALKTEEYNKLGEAASEGCVRLTTEDAKWLYDTLPEGTKIVVYDSEAEEPLPRPQAAKLDLDNPLRCWDPTDPNEKNPWVGTAPGIALKEDIELKVEVGGEFSLDGLFQATDYKGQPVDVQVSGTVNSYAVGEYKLTCSATDTYGVSKTEEFTVLVEDTTAPTLKVFVPELNLTQEQCLNEEVLKNYLIANLDAFDLGTAKESLSYSFKFSDGKSLAGIIRDVNAYKPVNKITVTAIVEDTSGNKSSEKMQISYMPVISIADAEVSVEADKLDDQNALVTAVKEAVSRGLTPANAGYTVEIKDDSKANISKEAFENAREIELDCVVTGNGISLEIKVKVTCKSVPVAGGQTGTGNN